MTEVSGSRKRKQEGGMKELEHAWDECFNRIYALKRSENPSDRMGKSGVEDVMGKLRMIKLDLNDVKSKLDDIDLEKWRQHTSLTHKCQFVMRVLRSEANGEIVTQAWAKFSTILHTFDLLPEDVETRNELCTLHLCEAPGSFITCLHHYLQTSFDRPPKWRWTGTTLNPYYEGNDLHEMIQEDRFISETIAHWDFGADQTGNIMSIENLEYMSRKYGGQEISLVTADGSIDCSEDPGEQELSVSTLFFWEVMTALNLLSQDGCFVLKIFTTLEVFTITMLAFLVEVFEAVTLCKPGPSKPGNSEVYVVCQVFNRDLCHRSAQFHSFMKAARFGDLGLASSDLTNIPRSLLVQILAYAEQAAASQKQAILDNLSSFGNLSAADEKKLRRVKHYIAERFLAEFEIEACDVYLAPQMSMKAKMDGFQYRRDDSVSHRRGSFETREMRLERLKNELLETALDWKKGSFCSLWKSNDGVLNDWQAVLDRQVCTRGKRVTTILSSRFCSSVVISALGDAREAGRRLTHAKSAQVTKLLSAYGAAPDSRSREICEDLRMIACCPDGMLRGVRHCAVVCDEDEIEGVLDFCRGHELVATNLQTLKAHAGSPVPRNGPSSFDQDGDSVQLVVASLRSASLKAASIRKLIKVLSVLARNEFSNLILRVDDCMLTVFHTGIVYVLSKIFEEYSVVKPGSSMPFEATRYMLFHSCCDTNLGPLTQHFEYVLGLLQQCRGDEDILHLFPIFNIINSEFEEFHREANETLGKRQLRATWELHKLSETV